MTMKMKDFWSDGVKWCLYIITEIALKRHALKEKKCNLFLSHSISLCFVLLAFSLLLKDQHRIP